MALQSAVSSSPVMLLMGVSPLMPLLNGEEQATDNRKKLETNRYFLIQTS